MNATQTTHLPKSLEITRVFNAPRALVWQAWTNPERMMRWWGPEQFTSPFCQIDLRVGGKYLLCMQSPDGQKFWTTGEYLEIVPLEKLVCTDHFADEHGNIVSAAEYGMQGDWSEAIIITVTFEEVGGKTKMTLRQTGIPTGLMSDMTLQGWSGSFDKLAASLE